MIMIDKIPLVIKATANGMCHPAAYPHTPGSDPPSLSQNFSRCPLLMGVTPGWGLGVPETTQGVWMGGSLIRLPTCRCALVLP